MTTTINTKTMAALIVDALLDAGLFTNEYKTEAKEIVEEEIIARLAMNEQIVFE